MTKNSMKSKNLNSRPHCACQQFFYFHSFSVFRAEKSMNVVARWDFCGHFPLEFRLFSRFTNVSAPFKMSRSVTSIESKDQVSQPRIFPSIFIYVASPRRKKKSWQFWPKANQSLPMWLHEIEVTYLGWSFKLKNVKKLTPILERKLKAMWNVTCSWFQHFLWDISADKACLEVKMI